MSWQAPFFLRCLSIENTERESQNWFVKLFLAICKQNWALCYSFAAKIEHVKHDLRLVSVILGLQLYKQHQQHKYRRKSASISHIHLHKYRAQNGFNVTLTHTHTHSVGTLFTISRTLMQQCALHRKMTSRSRHHPLQRRRWKLKQKWQRQQTANKGNKSKSQITKSKWSIHINTHIKKINC